MADKSRKKQAKAIDKPKKEECKHETFISTRDRLSKEDLISDSYKDILNTKFKVVRSVGYCLTVSFLTVFVYGFILGCTGFSMIDILGIPIVIIGFILFYNANKKSKKELSEWLKTVTISRRISLFDAEENIKKFLEEEKKEEKKRK